MSGDLISRNTLIEALQTEPKYQIEAPKGFEGLAYLIQYHHEKIIEVIKNHPTAYNVDKVVEQLEHLLNNFGEHCEDWGGECTHKSCSDCVLSHAIEIVKAGGVE